MPGMPTIASVTPIGDAALLVRFEGGVEKVYDCGRLLSRPEFSLLKVPAFFRAVKVDPGGYGISWSDEMDVSEYELWTNGTLVADSAADATSRNLPRTPSSPVAG